MTAKYLFTFVFFTIFFSGFCQDEAFTDKAKLETDFKQSLSVTKNINLIKQGDIFFSQVYTNTLMDDINKQKLLEICKKMIEKGYSPNPYFSLMMIAVTSASQSSEMAPDIFLHYLDVLYKTVDLSDEATLRSFLQTSSLFLTKRAVFDYYNNSCYMLGGSFDFDYKGIFQLPVSNATENTTENSDPAQPDPFAETKPVSESDILNSAPQPTVEGPVIVFKDINIRLGSRYDTAIINNTEGDFMFGSRVFVGKRGKIDWSILDKSLSEIYVDLKEYNFNTTNNQLIIENVQFNYPSKLENSINGVFEFKSMPRTRKSQAQYPKFTSLTNDVALKNLGRNVNYVGGYCLSGMQFTSKCMDDKPASLIYNDGHNRFQTFSKQYSWSDSVVNSDPTAIMIFLDRDTLWHPGVRFTLNTSKQFAVFHRDRGAYKNSLFHDTFHGLEFSVDIINWDLTSDSMNLDIFAAKSQIPAMFKSKEFFREKDFTSIQSLHNFHPIRLLFAYQKATGTDVLVADDIIKKYKITTPAFVGAMRDLEKKGFVFYNEISGTITLRPKAVHFMQSFVGKADYDGLYIPSLSPQQVNATINMSDFSMRVRGVEKFFISDSANVYALPENKTVTIYGNREIVYNGTLIAGIYHMKGKNFRFNYEDFLLTLETIDTIKFIKQDKKPAGADSKVEFMDNQLLQSSGTLYINDPKNKSGKKKYPEYPKFDTKTGAYVYFNKKEILGGAYSRQVYFKIPPFKTDSVKSSDKSALKFQGQFISGGIFPEFDEQLGVMADNSLGFKHKTPPEGYEVFGGKGKFIGTLKLDNQGIRGDGELRYQSSVFYSNDFVFYQDSVIGIGQQAKIKELKTETAFYPEVEIGDYEMKWVQRDDSLHLINLKDPFMLYKKKVVLEGSLNITPKGLFGSGMMEIKKVNVIASHYDFRELSIEARHSVFNIKTPGKPLPSLSSNNARCEFFLEESYANISPEIKGLASLEFPFNQFKTSIENARWEMDKKIVTMEADQEHLENSYFYSTSPEKDSLNFIGAKAVYDITSNLLKVDGVPYVKVADCKIMPDSNSITVYEGAQLKPLKKAVIRVDTLHGYHTLYNGKIDIMSRNSFTGIATYNYVNSRADTFKIKFEKFRLEESQISKRETKRQTVADGTIISESKFYIAPKILYKGKAKLKADNQLLAFNGKVKIDIQTKGLKTDWFPYENDGKSSEVVIYLDKKPKNKKEISESGMSASDSIPAENPVPEENMEPEEESVGKLYTGVFYEMGVNDIYTAIVSTKINDPDEEIFASTGQLLFDQQTNSFVVGDPKRIKKEILAGSLYSYNDSSASFTSSGKFELTKPDQYFAFNTVGKMEGHLKHKTFSAHVMANIKLNMPTKALDLMGKKIAEIYEMHETHKDSSESHTFETTLHNLAQIESEKAARTYEKNYLETAEYKPLYTYAPKLKDGISIYDMHLNWSHVHKAWHNYAHIDLSNILGYDFHRRIKAFVELKKTDQGDVITFFIHPRSDTWFYISYQPGRLALLSSDPEFTKAVAEKSKGETGTPLIYTFVQPDPTEKQQYLKDFWKNYLGKEYNEEEEEKEIEEVSDTQAEQLQEKLDEQQLEISSTPTDSTNLAPASDKKSKKKKKKEDITDPSIETSPNTDVAPVESNNQSGEISAEPVPSPTKKSKKKKKKEDITAPIPEEQQTPPAETPPTETAPVEQPANQPTEIGAEPAPVPEKKSKKKKKKEDISEPRQDESPTSAPEETKPTEQPTNQPVEIGADPTPVPEKKSKKKKKKEDITEPTPEETPTPTSEETKPTEEESQPVVEPTEKESKKKKKKKGKTEETAPENKEEEQPK
ncbi:MAG: hypothetical protein SFY32_17020 [Bacteroidota bacterium]|nr:hypothetical protein [Bacteroidota bacterium]